MIKYIIVDDEIAAHNNIEDYANNLPNLKLVKNCYNALEAISFLNTNTVDLIFLDINMPKLTGFDFLKTLRNPPHVVVCSAYSEFAIDGYAFNITDYLLKPFSFERLLSAVNKISSSTTSTTKNESSEDIKTTEKHVFLKQNNSHIQVDLDSILFIEASGNYTKVITLKDTITIREKISTTLELFSDTDFLQVHKSFAVAKKHINRIEGNRIHIEDYIVPIGKLYKNSVTQLFK